MTITGTSSTEAVRSPDQLLQLVAIGDHLAFAELYDRTKSRVMGLIVRILRDPAQSEEVAQEVFLAVWQNAVRFDPGRGSALSWILRATHSQAIDRVRASQASRVRDLSVGVRDYEGSTGSVAEDVEIRVDHDRARRALTALTVLQRESVELAYFDGLTQREMSIRLSIPIGTVKTRLRDGLIRMREAMQTTQGAGVLA